MNNTTEIETNTDTGEKVKYSLPTYCFSATLLLVVTIVTGRLYYKYRHKLQPTHLFELSVLADIAAYMAFGDIGLSVLQRFHEGYHPFCLFSNFIGQTIR